MTGRVLLTRTHTGERQANKKTISDTDTLREDKGVVWMGWWVFGGKWGKAMEELATANGLRLVC